MQTNPANVLASILITLACSLARAQSAGCLPHPSPGSGQASCDAAVCAIDPFCCATEWDERCATEASVLCPACHPPAGCTLPVATGESPEPCGVSTDDPCAWPAGAATPLAPGTMVHGTVWATDDARDVDWFEITLSEPARLQVQCFSAGPVGALILGSDCPPTVHAESVDGCPSTCAACLPAGSYRVAVRPLLFEALSCSDPRAHYALQATVSACTPRNPVNDRCDGALEATLGLNAFDTSDASSEPAWLPSWCDEGSGLAFTHDVWFTFTAPGTAMYRFSTCGLTTFDSRVAVYGSCGGIVFACSDDACPDGGASVEVGLSCGETALVRVGGWGHGSAGLLQVDRDFGDGCGCPGDFDGSGHVDGSDLALLLLCFGDAGGPADLDGDGDVATSDIGLLLLMQGPCS